MTLREKVMKLLEVHELPKEERKALEFVVASTPEGSLDDLVYPEARAHVESRFEWYYRPDGELRRQTGSMAIKALDG